MFRKGQNLFNGMEVQDITGGRPKMQILMYYYEDGITRQPQYVVISEFDFNKLYHTVFRVVKAEPGTPIEAVITFEMELDRYAADLEAKEPIGVPEWILRLQKQAFDSVEGFIRVYITAKADLQK